VLQRFGIQPDSFECNHGALPRFLRRCTRDNQWQHDVIEYVAVLQESVLLKNQAQFAAQKWQRGPIEFAHVLTTDQQDTTSRTLDTGHQFE
jgi:hypothetical protein